MTTVEAVIFDIGGVVLESPLEFIAEFERRHGLRAGLVAGIVGRYTADEDGPWHRLERGEISVEQFREDFDRAVIAAGGWAFTAELLAGLAEHMTVRPPVLQAIRRLRGHGYRVGALTNTWFSDDGLYDRVSALREEFDVFVESCRVGMRKPEPRIYALACRELEVRPDQSVFLDDIGGNLRPARALGMNTIKVEDPASALGQLGRLLDLDLS